MSINSLANSLKAALNRAQVGSISAMLKTIAFGDFVRSAQTYLRAKGVLAAGTANPYVVQSGANSIALPEDAKALNLIKVYARAGTGTAGLLTIDVDAATAPAAGHVKISPNGDVLFNSTDAWTSVDVVYEPEKGDVVETTLAVASNSLTIPTAYGPVVRLLEAEALVGTNTGKFAIAANAASNGTTLTANLDLAMKNVLFNSANAVTSARVKLLVASAVDVDALLEGASIQM